MKTSAGAHGEMLGLIQSNAGGGAGGAEFVGVRHCSSAIEGTKPVDIREMQTISGTATNTLQQSSHVLVLDHIVASVDTSFALL